MTDKITLNDITSLSNETSAITTINNNMATIVEAFNNTLSRDGTATNTMEADLDMNSNKILNHPDPTEDTDVVTKGYADTNYGGAAAASAAASAAAAAISEANAASSATDASNSKDAAATSETNAAASATAASDAQTAAESAYDMFDDRFLGAKSSDPTLDNDGNALATGAIYFSTSSNSMRVYNGTSWQNFAASTSLDDGDYGDIVVSSGAMSIDTDAVTTTKILDGAVTTGKIGDLAVTTGKLNDSAVTTGKINDGAVTEAKMTFADNTTGNVSTSAHGLVPKATGDTTKFLNANGAYSTPTSQISYARLNYQVTSGTSLPTYTAGSWQTIQINTEVSDANNIVTLSSNAFTPIAGTFRLYAIASVGSTSSTSRSWRYRLRNTTTGVTVFASAANRSNAGGSVHGGALIGDFTANGTDTYEVQVYATGSGSTTAGDAMSTGENEIGTVVTLEKIG